MYSDYVDPVLWDTMCVRVSLMPGSYIYRVPITMELCIPVDIKRISTPTLTQSISWELPYYNNNYHENQAINSVFLLTTVKRMKYAYSNSGLAFSSTGCKPESLCDGASDRPSVLRPSVHPFVQPLTSSTLKRQYLKKQYLLRDINIFWWNLRILMKFGESTNVVGLMINNKITLIETVYNLIAIDDALFVQLWSPADYNTVIVD